MLDYFLSVNHCYMHNIDFMRFNSCVLNEMIDYRVSMKNDIDEEE